MAAAASSAIATFSERKLRSNVQGEVSIGATRISCAPTRSRLNSVAPGGEFAKPAAASSIKNEPQQPEEQDSLYEVELDKPYGIKFYKGSDGGTYIDAIAPGSNAEKTKMFQPGDKVLATSAVFGDDIWPAAEYGRTMYTVRQRIGPLLMKMQKRYGKREDMGASAAEIAAQRNANAIGDRLREIQIQNYQRKMEQKKQREMDLREGLSFYRQGAYEDALTRFESVLGLKPDKYEAAIASYNVACCYSKLDQIEAGLSALEEALENGFDDYKKVRTDEDLVNLRKSEQFKKLMDQYDEPFLNENAVKALKNLFGLFGRGKN